MAMGGSGEVGEAEADRSAADVAVESPTAVTPETLCLGYPQSLVSLSTVG